MVPVLHSIGNLYTNNKQQSSIPLRVGAHIVDSNSDIQIDHDICIPNNKFGFLNPCPPLSS